MRIVTNITDVMKVGNGWVGISDPKKLAKRNPWAGLTPEEAYRKGQRDERVNRVLRELDKKIT